MERSFGLKLNSGLISNPAGSFQDIFNDQSQEQAQRQSLKRKPLQNRGRTGDWESL